MIRLMGNSESAPGSGPPHGAHREFRNSTMPMRLPMPEHGELEKRFTKVLVSWERSPACQIPLDLYMPEISGTIDFSTQHGSQLW